YDNGGYGMGEDFSGMLYLIDLNNRVQYISTGGVMIDYISDYREELIFDAAEPYLMRSDWGGAAMAAMRRTSVFMDEGRERGMFRYDRDTGRRLSGYYNPLEMHEVLIALGGGLLAAAIMVGTVSAAYGLKGGTYKYDVTANAAYTLTKDDEQYLRETVTRTARPTSTGSGGGSGGRSGGSGVHRSSAGRSHGGGGRRF
ncbi:MAG: TPM domain-containing protein, partial [Clostridia bacterium]|nr:TPM domain-containing protein [Clostridia bacterium]